MRFGIRDGLMGTIKCNDDDVLHPTYPLLISGHYHDRKDHGDNHWIRCLVARVSANKITDWRFPMEAIHGALTLHVYRSEIAEAPIGDRFEHSLDDNAADVLMVKSNEEFGRAVARFP